jgi:hypothetical protein
MGINLIIEARAMIEEVNPNSIEEFMKGSFIAGLKVDRITYIVKARGKEDSLPQLVEITLQEESEVKS